MTWMLRPEECTGYQSTIGQSATTVRTVHDYALSGSPTMVNTGSGVAMVLTDGCSGAGKALSNAIRMMCGAIRSWGRSGNCGYNEVSANNVDAQTS